MVLLFVGQLQLLVKLIIVEYGFITDAKGC